MPFWRFAIIVVMLTTFTATLRHRLSDFRHIASSVNEVMAVPMKLPERFFMLPAPLRPEEGSVELATSLESSVRPAYAIATIVGTIGVVAVATRDAVPNVVTGMINRYPAALPVLLIGLVMFVHTAVAVAKQRAGEVSLNNEPSTERDS